MIKHRYQNFVKASPSGSSENQCKQPTLSGEQAKEIYLKVIKDAENSTNCERTSQRMINRRSIQIEDISNKDLFLCVQNNDVKILREILDCCPSMVSTVDEYGWSLLMIACQANAEDAVKELLARGADTSVRDKGGNSATNLVIKNKNLQIADLLITHRSKHTDNNHYERSRNKYTKEQVKVTQESHYKCKICNKVFPDMKEHLASTVHNISASRDKKLPTNYVIPQTNRGYQIMLKVGWDRESGLGRDGSGKKYPIKAVQKKDRKGLGLDKNKKKEEPNRTAETQKDSKAKISESRRNRKIEINFRREFY